MPLKINTTCNDNEWKGLVRTRADDCKTEGIRAVDFSRQSHPAPRRL